MTAVLPPTVAPVNTVLICDERPLARGILAGLLAAKRSVDIATAADGFAVVDQYEAQPVEVVFIGIQRGSGTGLDAVSLLLGLHPTAAVIVFGSAKDAALLIAAVHRGARGLMLLDPAQTAGAAPLSTGQKRRSKQLGATGDGLTEDELLVLRGMSEGRSNSAIGRELLLPGNTVKSRARRLLGKLGARDRAHAVAIGLRAGLLN